MTMHLYIIIGILALLLIMSLRAFYNLLTCKNLIEKQCDLYKEQSGLKDALIEEWKRRYEMLFVKDSRTQSKQDVKAQSRTCTVNNQKGGESTSDNKDVQI